MAIKLICLSILVCSMALIAWAPGNGISGQRVCCEGDRWLEWNTDARESYVFGFTLGYSKGQQDGCRQGTSEWPTPPKPGIENDPGRKCTQQEIDFSRGSDYFTKKITEFYSRYREDRDIYPFEVLEQLGRGLTVEEIHQHPFLRHHSAGGPPLTN
jgi:hypothetical protein